MCNLYTLAPWEVRHLIQHYRLIGREFEEVMRGRNESLDVYPNHLAAVVVDQDGQRVVREMLWGFPPFKAGAGYGTNSARSQGLLPLLRDRRRLTAKMSILISRPRRRSRRCSPC